MNAWCHLLDLAGQSRDCNAQLKARTALLAWFENCNAVRPDLMHGTGLFAWPRQQGSMPTAAQVLTRQRFDDAHGRVLASALA